MSDVILWLLIVLQLCAWVAYSIVRGRTAAERSSSIAYFIRMAKVCKQSAGFIREVEYPITTSKLMFHSHLYVHQELRTLNNFDGMMALVTGLSTAAVARLKISWGVRVLAFPVLISMQRGLLCRKLPQAWHPIYDIRAWFCCAKPVGFKLGLVLETPHACSTVSAMSSAFCRVGVLADPTNPGNVHQIVTSERTHPSLSRALTQT